MTTKIDRTARSRAPGVTPEFINRIDKVVVATCSEHLQQILDIELGMVQQRVLMASPRITRSPAPKRRATCCTKAPTRYGGHLKRAIERLVFPMANLVATNQIRLGDFIRVDLNAEGCLTFVKEAEGAMVPMLMERYGAAAGTASMAARAAKPIAKPKEFTATPGTELK